MKTKIVLLTLVSVFLLSGTVVTSVAAQPRIVGVNVDDWFKYADITLNWSSNDPNATFPPSDYEWLAEMNETEWELLSIVDVSATNITSQITMHYKNGTEETSGGYVDVDTGGGENATFMVISADLNANDTIYTSPEWSDYKINETIFRTYPDSGRETNHINITGEYSYTMNETQHYYYYAMNFYWDRPTGILLEESFEHINQTGELLTTWSFLLRITESNIWVIPEFPTWTSTLLILIVLTVAIVFYKRRLPKTSIH